MRDAFEQDQPQTREAYIGAVQAEQGKTDLPGNLIRVWPWSSLLVLLPEPPGFPYWRAGPKDAQHALTQARRLNRIHASIQKYGFIARAGELPLCSLLIYDDKDHVIDYRAVVQHGNHRLAVLALLGWRAIPMTPLPGLMPNEVRLSDLLLWPGVIDGSFTPAEARATFMAFFSQSAGGR